MDMDPGDTAQPAAAPQVRPRVTPAADAGEVMREQLEYLLEHVLTEPHPDFRAVGIPMCSVCGRYLRAHALLLEMFA